MGFSFNPTFSDRRTRVQHSKAEVTFLVARIPGEAEVTSDYAWLYVLDQS